MKPNIISFVWILLLLIGSVGFSANAQTTTFPIYDNQRIPRPAGLAQVREDAFIINLPRLANYSDGFIYGDKQTLKSVGNYLLTDPAGKDVWKRQCKTVAQVLNQWDFIRTGFSANRYTYNLGQLEDLAIVYLFTGHRELGLFLKAHLLQIADLPYEFWLHAELRGYNPQFPLGMLETARVSTGVTAVLSASGDLFSKDERSHIESALRSKGLQPCLNWLKTPQLGNFTAVISSGAFVAARYLNDSEGARKALTAMVNYVNGSIEKDGSYGEGTGYFNYPIGSLFSAVLCMSESEKKSAFSTSGLRHSSTWEVYPYLFNTSQQQGLQPTIVHFGDNPYSSPPDVSVNQLLASLYQDSLATWLTNKFNRKSDLKQILLSFSSKTGVQSAKSPEQYGLPLLKVFDSGDCYIRSTWKDNGIVLGLRSGDGSLINFNHQRAELNSISMGAYGEYFIVSPGSASYRSPLHYLYDYTTRAANTITIDDKNQLFPGKGLNQWSTQVDNSAFWVTGKPKAEVIFSKVGEMADILVNEAAAAYFPAMKHARRTVLFVRDPGYFILIDKIESASDTTHKFSLRLHLNNRDGNGALKNEGENQWQFTRPVADFFIAVFSDQPIQSAIGKGYMHGPERDYSPGGENEGAAGSSVELTVSNAEKSSGMTFCSVLFPTKKGMSKPAIRFSKNQLTIGKDTFISDGDTYTLTKNGRSEIFKTK